MKLIAEKLIAVALIAETLPAVKLIAVALIVGTFVAVKLLARPALLPMRRSHAKVLLSRFGIALAAWPP